MRFVLLIAFLIFVSPKISSAQSCPWVPTVNQSLESIVKDIEKKSGKKPTVSCGTGADFKICHSCAEKLTESQWKRIRPMLAEPSYRKWHERLHSSAELDALTNAPQGVPYKDMQGESFLFAHREMVRATQANLAALGLPCVAPWAELPSSADNKLWPTFNMQKYQKVQAQCSLPKNARHIKNIGLLNSQMKQEKTKIAKSIQAEKEQAQSQISDVQKRFAKLEEVSQKQSVLIQERWGALLKKYQLSDEIINSLKSCPTKEALADENKKQQQLAESTKEQFSQEYVKNNSLGKMGNSISVLWHGMLHVYYNTIQPESCTLEDVAPECDNMDSNFSSQVNINFYKIHSYIDTYVENWLKANNYTSIEKKCDGRPGCYQWKGTFLGPIPDFIDGSGCTLSKNSESGAKIKSQSVEAIQ